MSIIIRPINIFKYYSRGVYFLLKNICEIFKINYFKGEMRMDCSLDLMRRLPPQNCKEHLSNLIQLAPELCEDLLSAVDQPLQVAKDRNTGREYLLCDYNRDSDSYR